MAIRVLVIRSPLERADTNVELALEYADLKEIAHQTGLKPLDLLNQVQEWGITTLVLLDRDFLEPEPELLDYALNHKLILVPQLSNQLDEQGFTNLEAILTCLFTLPNRHMLFFSGYEVYPYGNEADFITFAQILNLQSATVGVVEFLGEQKGLEEYLAAVDAKTIRIHPGYPYDTREELLLSVTDRNVRFLFLKPFKHMDMSLGNELNSLEQWITQSASDLKSAGYTLGVAQPITGIVLSPFMVLYLALGILSGLGLLVSALFPGIKELFLSLAVLFLALVTLFVYAFNLIPVFYLFTGLALTAALVFPSLGLILLLEKINQNSQEKQTLIILLRDMLGVLLITLSGGLIVNALFSETAFLNALLLFRGVKLSFFLPLFLTLVVLLKPYVIGRKEISIKQILLPGNLLKGLLVLLVVFVYLMRSGNEAQGVSSWELQLRLALKEVLGVRPRFKEFLTGYPALLLLPLTLHWPWVALVLTLLATAGQVSLFNTFVHAHTPILISLQRVGLGLALGLVLGLLAFFLFSKVLLQKVQETVDL